jgi:hypothetical protein
MYKVVLNSVQFFNVIYNSPTCFSYKVLHVNAGVDVDDVVHHIEKNLLGGVLGEDGGLGDIKLRSHGWKVVRLNTSISKGSPCCPPVRNHVQELIVFLLFIEIV